MNGELRKDWKSVPVSVYLRQETENNRLDAMLSEIHSYVDERYVDNLIDMARQIAVFAAKDERWLIFVRRKEDGEELQTYLESHQCKSVTITAKNTRHYDGRKIPLRSPRNRALDALVWRHELGCNVLISTSVLDNGISLHADAVDHLVLCQQLGNLYDMDVRACRHGEHDSNYYLRHRFSWLGKEYDPIRWIDYLETMENLRHPSPTSTRSGRASARNDRTTPA